MTDIPRLNKAQRAAKRKLSNEAQNFLNEFFSTYGGDFNTYNKLAAKYPALVSSEVLSYLKNVPGYAEQYPEVFGEVPSLESRYATQAIQDDSYSPSAEELALLRDTGNQVAQSALNLPSETANNTDSEEIPQEASIYDDSIIPKLKDAIDRGVIPRQIYEKSSITHNDKPTPELTPYYLKAGGRLLNDDDIATGIIRGDYGNGAKRVNNLYKIGLADDDINRTQKMVNEQLRSNRPTVAKSAEPVTAVEQPQETTAAKAMVNAISPEPIRAKNTGYAQPPLNHATDAIWDRVRKAGLSSPEQAIRSGLFSPDEVRYITENDLWRYRQ